jgi:hypothetical protein
MSHDIEQLLSIKVLSTIAATSLRPNSKFSMFYGLDVSEGAATHATI